MKISFVAFWTLHFVLWKANNSLLTRKGSNRFVVFFVIFSYIFVFTETRDYESLLTALNSRTKKNKVRWPFLMSSGRPLSLPSREIRPRYADRCILRVMNNNKGLAQKAIVWCICSKSKSINREKLKTV